MSASSDDRNRSMAVKFTAESDRLLRLALDEMSPVQRAVLTLAAEKHRFAARSAERGRWHDCEFHCDSARHLMDSADELEALLAEYAAPA